MLANVRQFWSGEVVLLFEEYDFVVPTYFKSMPGVSVFTYPRRDDLTYIPSVRPYLIWQYLAGDPARERETYFYIDSDIIFREWPHLGANGGMIVGSACDSYIGLEYILQTKRGPEIASKMGEVCGITVDQMKGVRGIGAHLLLSNPNAAFWERVYRDCNTLYDYFESLGETTNLQIWTAEMWAQLWGWVREGKTIVATPELDFCLPTDPIERYDEVKILHNAGILVGMSHEYFFKGQYDKTSPIGKDFDWVRRDKATWRYVQAVQEVVNLKA